VGDVESFIDALTRVAGGDSALDREVAGRMLGRRHCGSPVDRLSPGERDVVAAMVDGTSDRGIAETLLVSQAALERARHEHLSLELDAAQTEHRRVLAALA
jgi:DNA-binding NarL/FixJ family response regulator